jgi:hypothetical protein
MIGARRTANSVQRLTVLDKGGPEVDDTEFIDLHTASVTLMRAYFVEVEKSCAMLAECAETPLPPERHLTLLSQGIIEHEAHLTYVDARNILLGMKAALK